MAAIAPKGSPKLVEVDLYWPRNDWENAIGADVANLLKKYAICYGRVVRLSVREREREEMRVLQCNGLRARWKEEIFQGSGSH